MDNNRQDEAGEIPSRNSRFFKHGESWFFTTRECSIIGPYDSFQEALYGCRKFITQIQSINAFHAKENQCA